MIMEEVCVLLLTSVHFILGNIKDMGGNSFVTSLKNNISFGTLKICQSTVTDPESI